MTPGPDEGLLAEASAQVGQTTEGLEALAEALEVELSERAARLHQLADLIVQLVRLKPAMRARTSEMDMFRSFRLDGAEHCKRGAGRGRRGAR